MKNFVKYIIVCVGLIVCGLINNPPKKATQCKIALTDNAKYLASNESNFDYDHTTNLTDGEIVNSIGLSKQVRPNHNPYANFFILVKIWNKKLQTNYNQYKFYSKKLLVTFNGADIFYPFHHFW